MASSSVPLDPRLRPSTALPSLQREDALRRLSPTSRQRMYRVRGFGGLRPLRPRYRVLHMPRRAQRHKEETVSQKTLENAKQPAATGCSALHTLDPTCQEYTPVRELCQVSRCCQRSVSLSSQHRRNGHLATRRRSPAGRRATPRSHKPTS